MIRGTRCTSASPYRPGPSTMTSPNLAVAIPDLAIPTLPSRSLPATVAFYARLGFTGRVLGAGDSYAILTRGSIELHFFAHQTLDPATSHAGCYIRVQDADAMHAAFAVAAIPAAGIPRLDSIADRP